MKKPKNEFLMGLAIFIMGAIGGYIYAYKIMTLSNLCNLPWWKVVLLMGNNG